MKNFSTITVLAALAASSAVLAAPNPINSFVRVDVSAYDNDANAFNLAGSSVAIADTDEEAAFLASQSLDACEGRCQDFSQCYAVLFTADNCILLAYDGTEAGNSGASSFDTLSLRYDSTAGAGSCRSLTDDWVQNPATNTFGACQCGPGEIQDTPVSCAFLVPSGEVPSRKRRARLAGRTPAAW